MSGNTPLSSQTVGGALGHWLRRGIHIAMIFIPVGYYYWGDIIASWFGLLPQQFITVLLGLIIIGEMWRLKKGYVIFGQRQHEADHICSFAWGAISMCLVLLLVPQDIYAIPLVGGCALGDPIIGELKRFIGWWAAALVAMIVIGLLWWLCLRWMPQLPMWLPLLIAPITVLAEKPNLRWIDDNALMQLIPLMLLMSLIYL
ncbi:MAG: hypothetical protein COB66_03180 [Coxiella sp. (in: Bacteria)]|nr:MAG: hypothetical protein COB66_03180 [Coxiella sp. (in: g-proteobacteria)]